MVKYSIILAVTLCAATLECAINEHDVLRELEFKSRCYDRFNEVVLALKAMNNFSASYIGSIRIGLSLIELASKGENGLTDTEKVLWYRQLSNINEEKLAEWNGDQKPITLLAIKKVLCDKIIELLKSKTKVEAAEEIADVQAA